MAKTVATSTRSPLEFATNEDVLFERLRELCRAQNWSFIKRWECHVSLTAADEDWDDYSGGNSLALGTLIAVVTGSSDVYFQTDVWIETDAADNAEIKYAAQVQCAGGDTCVLTWTFQGDVGTQTPTLSFTSADNGTEKEGSFALNLVTGGNAWVAVQVAAQRTVGAGSPQIRTLRVEEKEVTTYPSPEDCDVTELGITVTESGVTVTAC